MLKKKILFIYNPISGILGKKMILSQIESKLDTHKFTYVIQKTQYAGHATELARNAVREGFDIVCAVGGDGTKHVSDSERKNIAIARKSIVAAKDIKMGELLTEENLTVKRPGTGISPMRWEEVIGTKAIRDFSEEELIEI